MNLTFLSLVKMVFQLVHFAPKSFAQIIYSTIMRVAKWQRDLWWLSLFCESVKWEQIWPFSYYWIGRGGGGGGEGEKEDREGSEE